MTASECCVAEVQIVLHARGGGLAAEGGRQILTAFLNPRKPVALGVGDGIIIIQDRIEEVVRAQRQVGIGGDFIVPVIQFPHIVQNPIVYIGIRFSRGHRIDQWGNLIAFLLAGGNQEHYYRQ